MKVFITWTFLLISWLTAVQAQVHGLVGKPYSQRLDAIDELYQVVHQDRSVLADTLVAMRTLAEELGDKELYLEAEWLEVWYDFRHTPGQIDMDAMTGILHKSRAEGVDHIGYRVVSVVGRYYWIQRDYEQAFTWYALLDSMMQSVPVEEFPDKVRFLREIGDAYYYFGDYEQAITIFRRATHAEPHPRFEGAWKHAMNGQGLAYQKLDSLDRSDSCFRQVLHHNHRDTEVWEGVVAGNLGYNEYLRGHYTRAEPLLIKDIRIAEQYGDYGLAAGSATPMADIRTRQGRLHEAGAFIDKAYRYIQRSRQTDRLRLLYPVMSRWHMAMGHRDEAAQYLDSALAANKQYDGKFSALILMRANQQVMAGRREAALQELHAANERRENRRNLIIGTLVVFALLVAFLGYRQRQVALLQIKERDLKLLAADRELKDARIQLEALARKASQMDDREAYGTGMLVEQLNRQTTLTEEGWAKFSELFAKLHPGFQHRLKGRCPTLTPAEIRCLSMEKLHYTNKEIAALQGISTNAVMVTKHRIRKKLNLSTQQELVEYVDSI